MDLFISRRYVDEQTRQLEKLIDLKAQIARIDLQHQQTSSQILEITQDQQRLRENIKTLTSTAEAKQLISRYVAKANDQETRLEQIGQERKTLNEQRTRLNVELSSLIRGLTLERKIN